MPFHRTLALALAGLMAAVGASAQIDPLCPDCAAPSLSEIEAARQADELCADCVAPPMGELLAQREPETRTLAFDVAVTRHSWAERTYTGSCAYGAALPGPMAGMIGWGQAEIGWLGENCFSFVLELAVGFDLSALDAVPRKTIDYAELSWDEAEAPSCPLVLGYSYRCWQDGDGAYEPKPEGCAILVVPALDWMRGAAPQGFLEVAYPSPPLGRLSGSRWDVTEAIRWRTDPPLGRQRLDTGFALTAPIFLRNLTAQDSTVCVSRASNIRLTVTFTIPPEGLSTPVR